MEGMQAMRKNKYTFISALFFAFALQGCEPAPQERDNSSSFPERSNNKHRVIVFVHGVLGEPRATWTNSTTGAFFPAIVSKDSTFDEADIFVYGFPSPKAKGSYNIDELTDHMRRTLDVNNITKNYDEVVFVCHSMGGIVTRAFLLKFRDIEFKVPMIYFFSTPSTGSSLAAFAKAFGKNPQFADMVGIADNTYLGSQQSSWLASKYANSVKSFCAYEVLDTYGVRVVDRSSATNLCNVRLDPIDANHVDIVKPKSEKGEAFIAFKLAYQETFDISGGSVILDSETLPNLLPELRSRSHRQSYVVRKPLLLAGLTGAREEWYAMNLSFEKEGIIYIGSRDLKIDVRGRFEVGQENDLVVAGFPPDQQSAGPSTDGKNGENGRAGNDDGDNGQNGSDGKAGGTGLDGQNAGNFELILRQLPTKSFKVALAGQRGGPGGNGGLGGRGGRGANGSPSRSGAFGCNAGGGDGGRGGNGGKGGDAAMGGNCGNGGQILLTVPEALRTELLSFVKVDETRATPGAPGAPGAPGGAGDGGGMGRGGGFCGGGRGGDSGRPGEPGKVPVDSRGPCLPTRIVVR